MDLDHPLDRSENEAQHKRAYENWVDPRLTKNKAIIPRCLAAPAPVLLHGDDGSAPPFDDGVRYDPSPKSST